jgi:hypothetical protein
VVVVQQICYYDTHQILFLVPLREFVEEYAIGTGQVCIGLDLLLSILEEVVTLGVEMTL